MRRKTVIGVVVGCALVLGCSGSGNQSTSQSATQASSTATMQGGPVPQPAAQSFSGNGVKSLGTITVPADSNLNWTNDGELFSVFGGLGSANYIAINSQARNGSSAVSKGTYRNVQVNALGNWTITIIPK